MERLLGDDTQRRRKIRKRAHKICKQRRETVCAKRIKSDYEKKDLRKKRIFDRVEVFKASFTSFEGEHRIFEKEQEF